MDAKNEIIDVEPIKPEGRAGDGGTYLVVADDSAEFEGALRYACRAAKAHRGHVGIIHVIEVDEFQHWGGVEERMRSELRGQAEQYIWSAAGKVNDMTGGKRPSLYVAEGDRQDVIAETIDNDRAIVQLILGSGAANGGNDPLVSYFTGKGMAKLRVPVLIVPGHIDFDELDAVT